jgi:hypothetical protein
MTAMKNLLFFLVINSFVRGSPTFLAYFIEIGGGSCSCLGIYQILSFSTSIACCLVRIIELV